MKDNRTEEEKYQAWVNAVNYCYKRGWKCITNWIFESPSGSKHDLSASNLEMLDYIEKNKISIVK